MMSRNQSVDSAAAWSRRQIDAPKPNLTPARPCFVCPRSLATGKFVRHFGHFGSEGGGGTA